MLCGGEVLALLHLIAALRGILCDVLGGAVGANERAELVIGCAIGVLREVDGLLHNGCGVLRDEVLAVHHLHDDVTLRQGDVLQLAGCHRVERKEVVLGVVVHRGSVLILACGEPGLLAGLTVLLGDSLEVATSLQSVEDGVGALVSLVGGLATHLNLAILHRVGELRLGDELDEVERVVHLALHRSIDSTYAH